MRDVPGREELLCYQDDGMVTRGQLRDLGMTDNALRWALGHGWRAVLPSVVSVSGAPLSPHQRLIAAVLHAGEDAMIGAATAAEWHGVTSAGGDLPVHVLAPHSRHPRSCGFVVVHRSARMDDHAWTRGPLTIASRARAVVDAGRSAASPERARAIVCEAVERRLVVPEALRHELETGPRQGSGVVRRAVQEVEAGAWSVPEGDLLRLVGRSPKLPPVWAKPTLTAADGTRLPTPDAWIDTFGLAIQVHSRRWHSGRLAWEETVMSDGVSPSTGSPSWR